ncbi:MAG TPA: hypothetical protein VGG79_09900 [Roseiarcus sp.]
MTNPAGDQNGKIANVGDIFGRGWSLPYLGRRAAILLTAASLPLLIVVGVLTAITVERVTSAADWTAHSLEIEAQATELLGQTSNAVMSLLATMRF